MLNVQCYLCTNKNRIKFKVKIVSSLLYLKTFLVRAKAILNFISLLQFHVLCHMIPLHFLGQYNFKILKPCDSDARFALPI